MRYDKTVFYFDKDGQPDAVSYLANVTEITSSRTRKDLFPDIKEPMFIFRFLEKLDFRTGFFEYEDKYYKIQKSQRSLKGSAFYGSESRGGLQGVL